MWSPPVSITASRRVKKFPITHGEILLNSREIRSISGLNFVLQMLQFCLLAQPLNQKWASSLNHICGRTSRCFSRWVWNVCAIVSRLCFENGVNDCNICSLYGYKPKSFLTIRCTIEYDTPSSCATRFKLVWGMASRISRVVPIFSGVRADCFAPALPRLSFSTLPVVSNFRMRR